MHSRMFFIRYVSSLKFVCDIIVRYGKMVPNLLLISIKNNGNPASIFGLRRQQTVEEVTKELENVKDDLQVRLSANTFAYMRNTFY